MDIREIFSGSLSANLVWLCIIAIAAAFVWSVGKQVRRKNEDAEPPQNEAPPPDSACDPPDGDEQAPPEGGQKPPG